MENWFNEFFGINALNSQQWQDYLSDKKPPERYVEGYISCPSDFDAAPGLTELVLCGFSYDEAVRMRKLMYIETLKAALEYKKGEMMYTSQELAAFDALIAQHIKEYNENP